MKPPIEMDSLKWNFWRLLRGIPTPHESHIIYKYQYQPTIQYFCSILDAIPLRLIKGSLRAVQRLLQDGG